jgi:class 3 adenylate cyclase/tetratricopeptide (TPR) repeat protein
VTVLFVDIVDSSRLAERLDVEAMHQVMDRVLRVMAEAVHHFEGTVNQFLGDGMMALFGAPVALEDHALRAIDAALAIQKSIADYSAQLRQERGVDINVRQGLNTGLVVVGRIGDDLRMDYTAVGDTTHLAARVQGLADPTTIVVTENTHRLISSYVHSDSLGRVTVKGRTSPVHIYRVTRRRGRRTRLEVSAERGLTPLVGRERELGLLSDRFVRTTTGRGHVVGIVGEPGVGKSRLLYELRKRVQAESATWLETHCVAHGRVTPYLPLVELLRNSFGIEDGDTVDQIQAKLREGVHRLDLGLDPLLPFLQLLLGLPDANGALRHLDPKDIRQKTFEALRGLALAGTDRRPHVLVVEDLHWIDETTEDWLSFLVGSLPSAQFLLLTTHRPGYAIRWADAPQYTQIALDLLAERDAEAMLSNLLNSPSLPGALLQILRDKAEGNPLFIEEITRSLVDRGILLPREGELHWEGGTGIEVPGSLQDLIRARIDRLDEPAKRTLQAASVIGRDFGLPLLSRTTGMADELENYLRRLKHVDLIHERLVFPETEYAFKHALIQEVAYGTLLRQRREALHGATGRAIENLETHRLEEKASLLAYHYARSEYQEKARDYAMLAGDRATRVNARAEARTYYEQALTIARALPRTSEAEQAEIDAVIKLATVSVTRDEMQRDQANLEAVCIFAEQQQDLPRLARVRYWLGRIPYVLGDPQRAIQYAEQSLEIAERLGDDALAAPPVNLMARSYAQVSEFAKAAPLVERSVEQMSRLGNKTDEASTAGIACWVYGQFGEFDIAFQYAERGVRVAREIDNPFAEAAAVSLHGLARLFRGAWDQAIADFEKARGIAERAGDLFRVYLTKIWEGWARTSGGDPGGGRRLLEDALALSERLGTRFNLSYLKANLAASMVALGELEPVRRLCAEAIEIADETGEKVAKGLAYRTLAEACFRQDASDRLHVEASIREAIQVHEQVQARPELARNHVSYARFLAAWRETSQAEAHLREAIAMFRAMDMSGEVARAERESNEL